MRLLPNTSRAVTPNNRHSSTNADFMLRRTCFCICPRKSCSETSTLRPWPAVCRLSPMNSARLRWIVGDDEFLVNTEKEDAIVTAIAAARGIPQTPRQVRASRAARFSWTKIGAMYRDFLRDVVARRAKLTGRPAH